jgi:hypothetical protein
MVQGVKVSEQQLQYNFPSVSDPDERLVHIYPALVLLKYLLQYLRGVFVHTQNLALNHLSSSQTYNLKLTLSSSFSLNSQLTASNTSASLYSECPTKSWYIQD